MSNYSPEQQRIERLECRLRKIQVFAVAATLSLVAALCVTVISRVYANTPDQKGAQAKNASFDTITVKRINVVENDGTRRLIISGATNPAPLIINGKVGKRAITSAGITFYNRKGDERGGISLARRHGGEQSALVFDYNRAEAIALVRAQHSKYANAELQIMDPPPAGGKLGKDGNVRTVVQTVNGDSEIMLNDAKGRPRLRLTVPKRGKPSIKFLDAKGKVTHKIASNGDSTGN